MTKIIEKLFNKQSVGYDLLRKIYLKSLYPVVVRPYRKWEWAERRVSWGNENAEKTFYIIRRYDDKCGIFSWLTVIIGHLFRAQEKGWIPVVDMKSYPNTFLEENEVGKVNAWEFFFKQPAGYTIEDIKKSKNIILSSALPIDNSANDIFYNLDKRKQCDDTMRKYIFFSDDIAAEIEYMTHKLLGSEPVLGVLCRGTDYWQLKPSKHAVQPNIEQIISQIDAALQSTGAKKIYLCTEDTTILHELTDRYRDILVTYPREYVDYNGGFLMDTDTELSKRQITHDYLMQIAVLAQTDYIVAGRVGGAVGAILLSKGYKYEYFWDLGIYE